MARLKLTLSALCLGGDGGRVSKSGEVSKSFFFTVKMYVERANVHRDGAEQLVVLQQKVNAQFQSQCFIFSTSMTLFSLILYFPIHSSLWPSLHNDYGYVSNICFQ